jgi:methyl-accepting chemotaxis protein
MQQGTKMFAVNNVSLTKKLPAAFIAFSLSVALFVGITGFRDFRNELVLQSQHKLEILTNERANAVQKWFQVLEGDTLALSRHPNVLKALLGFSATFGLLMEDPTSELQRMYIDDNPHPIGEKDLLNRAEDGLPYNFQHAAFHSYFRDQNNLLGLYDIFLFDLDGNLIYSVFKERDFAQNFTTGPLRDSGLGIALANALGSSEATVNFVDFAPYAPSSDAPAAFMAVQILDEQEKPVGVFALQLPSDAMSNVVANAEGLGETGEITLIGTDLKSRSNSRFEGRYGLLHQFTLPENYLSFEPGVRQSAMGEKSINGSPSISVSQALDVMGAHWTIYGQFELSEVYAAALSQRNKMMLIVAAAMVLVGTAGYLFSKSLTNPIGNVVDTVKKLSSREYQFEVGNADRSDEIGQIAKALHEMKDTLIEHDRKQSLDAKKALDQKFAVDSLADGLQKLASGRLDFSLKEPFSMEYEALRNNFNNTILELGDVMQNLASFATIISQKSEKMDADSHVSSKRVENQAATLEETAAALDQITSSVVASETDLKSVQSSTHQAHESAEGISSISEQTANAMAQIDGSSSQIGDIIAVVNDIAFQTNLLALNAGVEAARAGEAGRGFAVVASEVRMLAVKSVEAVNQIRSLVDRSAEDVTKGVALVDKTKSSIGDIVQKTSEIASLVNSISSNSSSQSNSISEINNSMHDLDKATQQNAGMLDTSRREVSELLAESKKLAEILKKFELPLERTSSRISAVAA